MTDQGWDRIANCGSRVCVGSQWSCDDQGHLFDRRVHVQYPDQVCPYRHVPTGDLLVTLVEKQPLGFELLDSIATFARQPGSLYVHCRAGMCRGPTVAVVCLVARGLTVGQAMGAVADAMVSQYKWFPIAPEFYQVVINEVYRWAKHRLAPAA